MAYLAYVAATVTLTAANTNYSLLALLQAIEPNCPPTAREVVIQSHSGNGSAVLVGDANLTALRCGYELGVGQSRTYRSGIQHVLIGSLFARSAGAAQKLNVEVMGA